MDSKTILLISPENWGKNFVSKHHYANYLAKEHQVFFLQNPEGWKPTNVLKRKLVQQPIKEYLTLIHLPNQMMRLNTLPETVQRQVYTQQAKEIHKQLGIPSFDIVWSFDPHKYWDLRMWNADLHIYHTVDFHPDSQFEEKTCKSADLVIGVADLIIEEIIGYHPRTFKITHGADIDNFQKSNKHKVRLPGSNSIKAGYVGNFHRHIDYPLLHSLAEYHQNVDFVMIGPFDPNNLNRKEMIEQEWLQKFYALPNVYFTGSVPSHELMNYMLNFDISLVLFDDAKARIHCNPHKMMGYYYAGNVVISSFIDEYKDKPKELIQMTQKNEELPGLFQKVLDNLEEFNKPGLRSLRRNYAEENSYDKQINKILTHAYAYA